jgi:hypothetical protein
MTMKTQYLEILKLIEFISTVMFNNFKNANAFFEQFWQDPIRLCIRMQYFEYR